MEGDHPSPLAAMKKKEQSFLEKNRRKPYVQQQKKMCGRHTLIFFTLPFVRWCSSGTSGFGTHIVAVAPSTVEIPKYFI